MGKCEIFNRRTLFSDVFGLDPQYDIEKIKAQCETYQEEMKFEKGEQMKW